LPVTVLEAAATPGGGARTAELTLPGFHHDVCSTVHPLAVASPFFRSLDLAARGVRLLEPEVQYAQPLEGGRAALAHRSLETTAASLGPDGPAWQALYEPYVRRWPALMDAVLAPIRRIPRAPLLAARFAPLGLRGALPFARSRFVTEEARALFGGAAAHGMLRLDKAPTAALGGLLGLLAHAVGWPVVEGGSQRLVDALVAELEAHGGELVTSHPVRSLAELDGSRAVLLDVTPHQLLELAGDRMPAGAAAAFRRFRPGPGVFKMDWALSGPVPWAHAEVGKSATVHLGGTLEELALSEAEVVAGRHPTAPYVLAVQPSVVDPSRSPEGKHILWAYCHVPNGSTVDMSERIEAQIERFAPGFRDLVLARVTKNAVELEASNMSFVGGDINGGAQDLRQTLFRPTMRWDPYKTGLPGVWLCSGSTPPGGGVHGMGGWWAARSVLRSL
jgi:phytoene dehydrogenase-like protein